MKKLLAEGCGSFMLVFIGTGSVMINASGLPIGNLGIAFTFGGTVALMILLFYRLSGAHFNPVVSVVACVMRKITAKELLSYISFQMLGGLLASFLLKYMFGPKARLGMTLPNAGVDTSFVLELMLTFVLVFLILNTDFSTPKNAVKSALLIGSAIFLEAFFGGAYTGASMNPMRSAAPALVWGQTADLWLYIVNGL